MWRDFFQTELMTGLRRGEICGLQWSDFDGNAGTLKVCRTLHSQRKGEYTVGETKTNHGMRTIILPHSVTEILRRRKADTISQWDLPRPGEAGRSRRPNAAYRHMKTLLQRAGLPSIRFHDLRHTFATHALTSGVDAKTLSGILGHTKASFPLDTYANVTDDIQRQAAQVMDTFMTEIFGKGLIPWQSGESRQRQSDRRSPLGRAVFTRRAGRQAELLECLRPYPGRVRGEAESSDCRHESEKRNSRGCGSFPVCGISVVNQKQQKFRTLQMHEKSCKKQKSS